MRAPLPPPAEKLVQTAESLWAETKKTAKVVLSLLGIGSIALLVPKGEGPAVEPDGHASSSKSASTLKNSNQSENNPNPLRTFPNGISLRATSGNICQFQGDAIVINLFENLIPRPRQVTQNNFKPGTATGDVYNKIPDIFIQEINKTGFGGKLRETLYLDLHQLAQDNPQIARRLGKQAISARCIICVGLGDRATFNHETIKTVGENIIDAVRRAPTATPITSIGTILHGAGVAGIPAPIATQHLSEGLFEEVRKNPGHLREISIVEFDTNKTPVIQKQLDDTFTKPSP